jgi:CheY-like chemotaxis protein
MVDNSMHPVILVDDHDDTRSLLVELLLLDGYRVVSLSTGREVLALLPTLPPPCLILLDLGLPDMSGIELATQLRRQPQLVDTPLFALSGFSHLRDRALGAGFDGFLLKPVLADDLRMVLDDHCARGEAPQEEVA